MGVGTARWWHGATALVAVAALVLQLVLVVDGNAVLAEHAVPGLGLRVARYVSYFTIQSNVLVAATATVLARDPRRDGRAWRVVRVAAVVGITVTGLVHFLLLRPLLHLHGWSYVADKMLHMVVPVMAVLGWLVLGPRPRVDLRSAGIALLWPILWLVETLVVGGLSGWFPYPFLDFDDVGWAHVGVTCLAVTLLFVLLLVAMGWVDRRAPAAPLVPAVPAAD